VFEFLAVQESFDVLNAVSRVEVGNVGRPACANATAAINQTDWDDRHELLRFHHLAVILHVFEDILVFIPEYEFGDWGQFGEDVP